MSCNRNRDYQIREAIQVWSLFSFCGPGPQRVGYRSCSNKPNGAWKRIVRRMTQIFEETAHQVCFFLKLSCSRKEMSSPRRASRPFTFVAQPRQKKPSLILFWHETSNACTPRCVVGLIGTLEIEKLIVVKVRNCQTEDLANMSHRRDLTVSENRVRVNEES